MKEEQRGGVPLCPLCGLGGDATSTCRQSPRGSHGALHTAMIMHGWLCMIGFQGRSSARMPARTNAIPRATIAPRRSPPPDPQCPGPCPPPQTHTHKSHTPDGPQVSLRHAQVALQLRELLLQRHLGVRLQLRSRGSPHRRVARWWCFFEPIGLVGGWRVSGQAGGSRGAQPVRSHVRAAMPVWWLPGTFDVQRLMGLWVKQRARP